MNAELFLIGCLITATLFAVAVLWAETFTESESCEKEAQRSWVNYWNWEDFPK